MESADSTQQEEKYLFPVVATTYERFTAEAFNAAELDFTVLFTRIFSRAIKLATNDLVDEKLPKIEPEHWKEAYWAELEHKKRLGRYGNWRVILRWSNKLIPLFLGLLFDPKLITNPSQPKPSQCRQFAFSLISFNSILDNNVC